MGAGEGNTITASREPGKLPWQEIYQWASLLTTEQLEEYPYFWTPETRALLRRLRHTRGNLIAVIGLQGVGKTALKQALYYELIGEDVDNPHAFIVKWTGRGSVENAIKEQTFMDFKNSRLYVNELAEKLYNTLGLGRIPLINLDVELMKQVPGLRGEDAWRLTRFLSRGDVDAKEVRHLVPLMEKAVGREAVKEVRKIVITDWFRRPITILIDFPDYDKLHRGQMLRDLRDFQAWWDDVIQKYEGMEQLCNIVVFWQKELYGGHFAFGKFDVFELKPLKPRQLVEFFNTKFKTHVFAEDALLMLGKLSRGIFRWFKKYVRVCLDNYYEALEKSSRRLEKIGLEQVREWITLRRVAEDWDRELIDLFPRSKPHRVKAAAVLRHLLEEGETAQKKLRERLFGEGKAGEMECSRILSKLEAYGYILRTYRGREKYVNLVEPS